jgi:hypothetical protein
MWSQTQSVQDRPPMVIGKGVEYTVKTSAAIDGHS